MLFYVAPLIMGLVCSMVIGQTLLRVGSKSFKSNRTSPGESRRHISRIGGLAIVGGFLGAIYFNPGIVIDRSLEGLFLGLAVITTMGIVDDIYNLSAKAQLLGQVVAASLPVFFGLSLEAINSPFGGTLPLTYFHFGPLALPGALIIVFWLVLMMNALNWHDGLDGLAGGTAAIGAAAFFAVSILPQVSQPSTAILALSLMGGLLGFLLWNWPPAKLFMGTAGSMGTGYLLGGLAIVAGSKLALAAIVFAVPVLDLFLVIFKRLKAGHSIFMGDYQHLHFELLKTKMSSVKILGIMLTFTTVLGILGVYAPTWLKSGVIFVGALAVLLMSWRYVRNWRTGFDFKFKKH